MAYEIVWSPKAIKGYNDIINYLETNWTEREIRNFIKESDDVFELLRAYPEMFQRSTRYKTIVDYSINLPLLAIAFSPGKSKFNF